MDLLLADWASQKLVVRASQRGLMEGVFKRLEGVFQRLAGSSRGWAGPVIQDTLKIGQKYSTVP